MKRTLFVYNPKSGMGQVRLHLAQLVELFSEEEMDVCVYPTKAAGDAARVVKERARDFDVIVCAGGDGTLDEVVTGVMKSGVRRPIGYLPAGSTNDFAASVGIPRQIEEAAEVIVSEELFSCDLGWFNRTDYFVYVAAFGVLTEVSYETKQELKNVLGHAAYVVEAVKRLGTWKSHELTVESEEFSESGEFLYGMVTNADSVGGIRGLTGRNIHLDDGLFEVMLVRAPQDLMDWQKTILALLSGEEDSECIIRFKTRCVRFAAKEPIAWTRDGENGGVHYEVLLENVNRAFDIFVEPYGEEGEREEEEFCLLETTKTEE